LGRGNSYVAVAMLLTLPASAFSISSDNEKPEIKVSWSAFRQVVARMLFWLGCAAGLLIAIIMYYEMIEDALNR
jgi:hypothetical protein